MGSIGEYSQRLFRFIRGRVQTDEDAEDILQDVWYQYFSHKATNTIRALGSWLFTVARNKITDTYRKKKMVKADDIPSDEDEILFGEILFSNTADPETLMLRDLFWEQLWLALEELPDNQRKVFVENEIEGRTLQEIADDSKENIKTIISRKRYAVQHLRTRLQYLYDDLLNY